MIVTIIPDGPHSARPLRVAFRILRLSIAGKPARRGTGVSRMHDFRADRTATRSRSTRETVRLPATASRWRLHQKAALQEALAYAGRPDFDAPPFLFHTFLWCTRTTNTRCEPRCQGAFSAISGDVLRRAVGSTNGSPVPIHGVGRTHHLTCHVVPIPSVVRFPEPVGQGTSTASSLKACASSPPTFAIERHSFCRCSLTLRHSDAAS